MSLICRSSQIILRMHVTQARQKQMNGVPGTLVLTSRGLVVVRLLAKEAVDGSTSVLNQLIDEVRLSLFPVYTCGWD